MRAVYIAVGLVALIGCAACDSNRLSKLEKEVQALRTEVQSTKKQPPSIELQSKCSADAGAFFKREWPADKDTILLDYSNHYNLAQGKCFVLIEWHYNIGIQGTWVNTMVLYDVYEHSKLAEFGQRTVVTAEKQSEPRCDVMGATCTSAEDFGRRVSPFLHE